jgi:hypothetical protein
MSLSRKAFLVFAAAFILGAFCGLAAFRIVLSFAPLGEQLQDRFNEACAYGGETDRLEKLYLAGAFPNGRIIDGGPEGPTGYPPDPPLFRAASFGNAEVVQWLIDHGAAVNSKLDEGDGFSTPLDEAEGHLRDTQRTIEILKAHGAKNAYQR